MGVRLGGHQVKGVGLHTCIYPWVARKVIGQQALTLITPWHTTWCGPIAPLAGVQDTCQDHNGTQGTAAVAEW
jgi:hypothetical protein